MNTYWGTYLIPRYIHFIHAYIFPKIIQPLSRCMKLGTYVDIFLQTFLIFYSTETRPKYLLIDISRFK